MTIWISATVTTNHGVVGFIFSISVILINASTIPIFIYTNAKCFFNLKQNEVSMRMLKADPQSAPSIFNLLKDAKDEVTNLLSHPILRIK